MNDSANPTTKQNDFQDLTTKELSNWARGWAGMHNHARSQALRAIADRLEQLDRTVETSHGDGYYQGYIDGLNDS